MQVARNDRSDGYLSTWDKPLQEYWEYEEHRNIPISMSDGKGGGGGIDPFELPIRLKEERPQKVGHHVTHYGLETGWLVSKTFKGLVEEMEPNVHGFLPTEILRLDGSVSKNRYFLLKIRNVFDALDLEHPDIRPSYTPIKKKFVYYVHNISDPVYFDRKTIGKAALWYDKNLRAREVFCSDAFAEALCAYGDTGLRFREARFFDRTEGSL